jgi:glycerol-1-phosphate dehydrogenase [NAD(P)+]
MMELEQLLGNSFDCRCGKRHEVPIRAMLYRSGAIDAAPEILAKFVAGRTAALVADQRTWTIGGQSTLAAFERAGWNCRHLIISDTQPSGPSCDDVTVSWLKSTVTALTSRPDVLIAIGSGTVNDLTKWASFDLGLPYAVVATAASMNGYSAANVAPMVDGVKVLVRAAPPLAVFAEPAIIEAAPFEMTASGFGDAIAKCMSGADWLMNSYLLGEHYCPLCSGIVDSLEHFYLSRPEDIMERKRAAIEGLFRGLFWSGVAMTMIGSSAPASGGEHLLSHTLDMMAVRDGQKHDLHGRQVGIGTIFSAALYERLLQLDRIRPAALQKDIDSAFWKTETLVSAVREQWQGKMANIENIGKILEGADAWNDLKSRIGPTIRPPRTVKTWLAKAGAAATGPAIDCPRDRLREALLHMHEIRRRFTVVDLAWIAGLMPDIVDDTMAQWLE